jgi:hypothetical protein
MSVDSKKDELLLQSALYIKQGRIMQQNINSSFNTITPASTTNTVK